MILVNSSAGQSLKIFQPFMPKMVPVGMGYLMADLERRGIPFRFVDEQNTPDPLGHIRQLACSMDPPHVFGFSVLTGAFRNAATLSRRLKQEFPDCRILFGGIHPSAAPEESLQLGHVDYVVRGEADLTLHEVSTRLKGRSDVSDLPGLSFIRDGRVVHTPSAPIVRDLDELPSFPYQLFEARNSYDMGFIVSSRGCPYRCIFCSNRITTGHGYRFNSSERILQDLDIVYNKHGYRSVVFYDDNFLVNKDRIHDLLREVRRKGLHKGATYKIQARGDNVDREILTDLFNSGFSSISFGLETASEDLMRTIKKGETVAQCIDAVRLAKSIGFHVSATFIFALPGETRADRMKAAALSKEIGIDMVRFNNATPYPGTELYEVAKLDGGLNVIGQYDNFCSVSTFVENPFRKIPFSYVPPGSSETEIRDDILLSYLSFYGSLKKLRTTFNSPSQGMRWFDARRLRKLPALGLLGLLLGIKFSEVFGRLLWRKAKAALSQSGKRS